MCPIHSPKDKERRPEQRLRLATFRLKVFVWPKENETRVLSGFGFLSEFSLAGAGLFLPDQLAPASLVRLSFGADSGPTYRAIVAWSNRFSLRQRFVGHDALSFRVGVKYQFGSEAERQRCLKYFDELKKTVLSLDGTMKY
jgi:hypothetical protein